MPGIPRELRNAQKEADRLGWTITRCGSGHLRWTPPQGGPVFTSSTPSGNKRRGIKNAVAILRRAGLPI